MKIIQSIIIAILIIVGFLIISFIAKQLADILPNSIYTVYTIIGVVIISIIVLIYTILNTCTYKITVKYFTEEESFIIVYNKRLFINLNKENLDNFILSLTEDECEKFKAIDYHIIKIEKLI